MSQFLVEQSVYFAISMHLINEFKYSCLIVLCYIFCFILDLSHFLNRFSNILNLLLNLLRAIQKYLLYAIHRILLYI